MHSLTVIDLIQKLQHLPQDTLVLIDGYEGGLDTIIDSKLINVTYDESKAWYYGSYEVSENSGQAGIYLLSTRGTRI